MMKSGVVSILGIYVESKLTNCYFTQELFGAEAPPTVIVGHAMGAAAGVHAAVKFPAPSALVGLMAVDVVTFGEDATSLPHIMSIVAGQQSEFNDFADALNYALRSGALSLEKHCWQYSRWWRVNDTSDCANPSHFVKILTHCLPLVQT